MCQDYTFNDHPYFIFNKLVFIVGLTQSELIESFNNYKPNTYTTNPN